MTLESAQTTGPGVKNTGHHIQAEWLCRMLTIFHSS